MATSTRGVVLSTYLDPEDAQLLRQRARKADRSIAAELRRCLKRSLSQETGGAQSASDQASVEIGGSDL
jgi:plasmid stability protein